jgi:tetratricopeptide (TPR) repeat protein
MNTRLFPAIFLVLLGPVAMANSPEADRGRRMLSPPEILEIVEKSDVMYNIVCPIEGLPDVNPANTAKNLFPLSAQPAEYPLLMTKDDGSTVLAEYPFSAEVSDMFNEAENLFTNGRYAEAIRSYQKIIDRSPDCYIAYAHIGDSYYKMKQHHQAIGYFDKAIEINPLDHRTFLYKADALMHLGRPDEAKAAYIHALSLRPRYWLALANLRHFADTLNVEVRTDLFQPKVFVRREKDAIGVYISDEQSLNVWLPYALAKAIWLGEPSHREPHLGDPTYRWSSAEETEALYSLITVYKTLKHLDATKPDPKLDLLEKITEAGDLPYFIGYEIASRISPHVTLTLPEEVRQSLREFIAKYVVVSIPQDKEAAETSQRVASNVAPSVEGRR